MIEIHGLRKRFGTLQVLDGVDLVVPEGRTLVVLGRSGTGKSVLLKNIIGLIRPDEGSIQVDDQEVTELDYEALSELRKRFGMVFQMAALFDSMSVQENVGLGLREHTGKSDPEVRRIVTEKLALVGLEGVEDKMPSELSGGMRKRVGLARALAMDPAYLLYDEPTTGLDPITSDQINVLTRQVQSKLGVTSVVVTHDMNSAFHVGDHFCLLRDGKIHFSGTADELRDSEEPFVRQFVSGDSGFGRSSHQA
ncbi:MAG: ABC transporter ATP-binding protein [Candidatus Eisenbacteria bacterium]|uniref:ABC transporter ATP-binding protein n=1 Tax=Eiseniibacteriota bacterium TaxID=2212470 RepID=A0A956RRK7_UNCEI|nr:ABC transporter ATP-binding protein [Candidatus Eisenbacteria bacterium]